MIDKSAYQKCPICGADMHLVRGRFGTFLACDNYKVNGCNGRAADPNREECIAKKKEKTENKNN